MVFECAGQQETVEDALSLLTPGGKFVFVGIPRLDALSFDMHRFRRKEIDIIDQLLQTIPYVEITRNHYHRAGLMSQQATREGRIFSVVDMILAVVAHDEQLLLFSLDAHFNDISRYCPLALVRV